MYDIIGGMKSKSLTDTEFLQVLRAARSTADPDFIELEDRLKKEGRALTTGLTRSQKARLYYLYKGRLSMARHGQSTLIYLRPEE